jgi:hypothetical protein
LNRDPDPEKLNALMGKLVGDLGAVLSGALILLGDQLGLYKAMADGKPDTPKGIVKRTMRKRSSVAPCNAPGCSQMSIAMPSLHQFFWKNGLRKGPNSPQKSWR